MGDASVSFAVRAVDQASDQLDQVTQRLQQLGAGATEAGGRAVDAGAGVDRLGTSTRELGGVLGEVNPQLGGLAQSLGGVFSQLSGSEGLSVGLAAGTGALIGMGKSAGDLYTDLVRLSASTGLSIESTHRWSVALDLAGSNAQTLSLVALRLSAAAKVELAGGSDAATKAMDRLGVSLLDAHGQMRGMDDVLPELFSSLSRVSNQTEQLSLANDLFSRRGRDLIPFLSDYADVMDRASGLIAQHSVDLERAQQKMVEYRTSVEDLKLSWEEVVTQSHALDFFVGLSHVIEGNILAVKNLSAAYSDFVDVFSRDTGATFVGGQLRRLFNRLAGQGMAGVTAEGAALYDVPERPSGGQYQVAPSYDVPYVIPTPFAFGGTRASAEAYKALGKQYDDAIQQTTGALDAVKLKLLDLKDAGDKSSTAYTELTARQKTYEEDLTRLELSKKVALDGAASAVQEFNSTLAQATAALKPYDQAIRTIVEEGQAKVVEAYLLGGDAQARVVNDAQTAMLHHAETVAGIISQTYGTDLPKTLTEVMRGLEKQADDLAKKAAALDQARYNATVAAYQGQDAGILHALNRGDLPQAAAERLLRIAEAQRAAVAYRAGTLHVGQFEGVSIAQGIASGVVSKDVGEAILRAVTPTPPPIVIHIGGQEVAQVAVAGAQAGVQSGRITPGTVN